MWENAAPLPPPQPATTKRPRRKPHGADGDFVLWGQFWLSFLAVAIVFGATMLQWPFLPSLRIAFEAAMQPDQTLFLSDERIFSKFTEHAMETLGDAAQTLHRQWAGSATAETADRIAHDKAEQLPSGAREESYLPDFPLCFPLASPGVAKTSGYGWRTDPMGGSGSDFHLGNDLAAAEGTPVLAAADGIVRYAGTHTSYGNYLRILHANGDETLYAHLQYLFVHTGQRVTAGQCLGTVGETGNTTGPHLHFEILHKGIRYDPSEALQAAS